MKKTFHKCVRMLNLKFAFVFSLIIVAGAMSYTFGASNSNFGQTINAGTLSTDIRDASRTPVVSPSVAMSATTVSFDCQQGGTASTGTFGSNTQRIYVDNKNAANNGWTLALAATSGATSKWTGATYNFDFNDAGGSPAGCGDGTDPDSLAGQMTVDASVGTLTADCTKCTTANISKGASSSYVEGTTDSITLLSATSTASKVGRWYLTGVAVKQTIPPDQEADSYTINMSLTATAL
jgi:hypothetical protein